MSFFAVFFVADPIPRSSQLKPIRGQPVSAGWGCRSYPKELATETLLHNDQKIPVPGCRSYPKELATETDWTSHTMTATKIADPTPRSSQLKLEYIYYLDPSFGCRSYPKELAAETWNTRLRSWRRWRCRSYPKELATETSANNHDLDFQKGCKTLSQRSRS